MAESMAGLKRSHRCTELGTANIGKKVTVMGWVQKSRNKGGIIFVDLRDRSGILQLIFEEADCGAESFAKAEKLRSEFVIAVTGRVEARSGAVNENLKTGAIVIRADYLRILAESETPPFPIEENSKTKEDLRLKYRFLELRRPDIQRNLMTRSRVAILTRAFLAEEGFLEIETPTLIKSTPEGARDYLVPSRVHPGSFYALPQSPQLFKQILMVAGMEKYFQIARCFRDEDLRADRQPEFTQLDMEMSFIDEDDIMTLTENLIAYVFKNALGKELQVPFGRMTWDDAMDQYGSDKPDLRFGMKLVNMNQALEGTQFKVFKDIIEKGGLVKAINVKGYSAIPRRELDGLVDFVGIYGAKGLAWIIVNEDGSIKSPIAKFFSEEEMKRILETGKAEKGDVLLFVADKNPLVVAAALGALRLEMGKRLNLIDPDKLAFTWVVKFPMFEYSEEEHRYVAMHHPFTSPNPDDIPLLDTDPGAVRANAYDMVIYGFEVGGGSIRIHDSQLQDKMFKLLGFTEERAQEQFGFLMNAFKYGAPPHGGLAYGLDRFVSLFAGLDSIRDCIAFPKNNSGRDVMLDAPGVLDPAQLDELNLIVDIKEGE